MEGIKRRRLGSEAWRELFRRQAASGEPIGTFCQREGVSTHSYRRWKLRLGGQGPTPTSSRSSPKRVGAVAAPSFVDLGSIGTVPPAAGRLEVRLDLGGGLTLHLVRG
jgi:hypothetical protein